MRWTIKPKPSEEKVKQLAAALKVEEFVATLLVQRGIETFEQARQFFRPTLADLNNPFLMKDMDKAVERIEKAIEKGENILVFGDYDVDGTTAVSLVSSYLKTIIQMWRRIFRIVMTRVTESLSRELTLLMTTIFH